MAGRGSVARRTIAVLLAIGGTTAIVIALRPPVANRAPVPAARLGTPLWSARRIPQAVADGAESQRLQAALAGRVGAQPACFTVRDASAGLAEAGPETALIPASTLKLATATAALDRLGPGFHFTTTALAPPAQAGTGTVDRLYLQGGGDPLLATPERIATLARDPEYAGLPTSPLATLADRIAATGVRAITGGVVGVDDRYDRTRFHPSWNAATRAAIGPVGALTVNDGFAGPAGTGPAVGDPALNAAAELTRLLAARGVTAGPPGRADTVPAGRIPVATLDSAPLADVIGEMLSASDNLTAEMLVRELAHAAKPTAGATTAAGVDQVRAALTRRQVDLTGAVIVDGSGLSRDDRLRCATLLQLLELTHRPRFAAVADGLAVAGRRGTLATELRGTPLAGNLRAKTGTLAGVSALAGFVRADRPLTFALIVTGGFGEPGAFAIREAMATDIQSFGAAFGTAAVPAPNRPIGPRACPSGNPAC